MSFNPDVSLLHVLYARSTKIAIPRTPHDFRGKKAVCACDASSPRLDGVNVAPEHQVREADVVEGCDVAGGDAREEALLREVEAAHLISSSSVSNLSRSRSCADGGAGAAQCACAQMNNVVRFRRTTWLGRRRRRCLSSSKR
eukprot:3854328-Pleurochrysis_carterae.AAC.1